MKKLLFIASMMLFSSLSSFAIVHVDIGFDLARPRMNCLSGFWFCHVKGGVTEVLNTSATIIDIRDGQMTIQFSSELNGHPDAFFAEKGEEVVLPNDVARQLGYGKVTILTGRYSVDYTKGKNGQIVVNVETD